MIEQVKIPKPYIDLLDQVFEIERKVGTLQEANSASIVLEFTARFPDIMVHAQGSTPARTRLYQMGIMTYWNEIEPAFHVFGFTGDAWLPFEKNVNYTAFFVLRKKS
jgi:hypothetical protein